MEQESKTAVPTAKKRKWWFRFMKNISKCRYKKPRFIYLGEEIGTGGIILSNHEGTDSPMSLELYCDRPLRMWGTWEMNSGLSRMYKYQTRVYFHEKKHWNLHLARLFCLLASPISNLFYKGLDLISTYKDARFRKTLNESLNALWAGDNVVIFPEVSDNGYEEELQAFHLGFVALGQYCQKKGMDVPVYVTYYRKKDRVYIIDKPILFSELSADCKTKEEIAKRLVKRCNALGKMQFAEESVKVKKKKQTREQTETEQEAAVGKV